MQQAKSFLSQVVASQVTSIAMGQISSITCKKSLMIPYISKQKIDVQVPVLRPVIQTIASKALYSMLPEFDCKKPVRTAPYVLADTLVSFAADSLYNAITQKQLPTRKEIIKHLATDSTKDLVYSLGKSRTTFNRPVNNFVWGTIAGATAEKVDSLIEKREAQCLKKGLQCGTAKAIYGEVKAAVMGGELF